jgi:hypothetical protein
MSDDILLDWNKEARVRLDAVERCGCVYVSHQMLAWGRSGHLSWCSVALLHVTAYCDYLKNAATSAPLAPNCQVLTVAPDSSPQFAIPMGSVLWRHNRYKPFKCCLLHWVQVQAPSYLGKIPSIVSTKKERLIVCILKEEMPHLFVLI